MAAKVEYALEGGGGQTYAAWAASCPGMLCQEWTSRKMRASSSVPEGGKRDGWLAGWLVLAALLVLVAAASAEGQEPRFRGADGRRCARKPLGKQNHCH